VHPERRLILHFHDQRASHDDRTQSEVAENLEDGIRIAEFPVTLAAAQAARAGGQTIIAGAPNLVRGGSHTGNVAVLDLLRRGTQPAGQIARAFPISRPAISKHLRLLRRAHLVQERREGRHRLYQLNPEPLKAVDSWLEQYRTFWQTSLESLKTFVETEYAKENAQHRAKHKGEIK